MKQLKDKVIVITGAGSGIGRALALHAAAEGAMLAINDWDGDSLGETAHLITKSGAECLAIPFDVSKQEEMDAFADEVVQRYGRVDIMINNAGLTLSPKPEDQTTIEEFEKVLGVNMWGMIYGSRAFLPHLKKRPESALVNVSSIFGMFAFPSQSAYNTSKFAIKGYTESLRNELRKTNVTISTVHPGGVKTHIVRNASNQDAEAHAHFVKQFDRGARTSPERAAEVIFEGIAKKRNRIMIGTDAWIMERVVRWFPQRYDLILGWIQRNILRL